MVLLFAVSAFVGEREPINPPGLWTRPRSPLLAVVVVKVLTEVADEPTAALVDVENREKEPSDEVGGREG